MNSQDALHPCFRARTRRLCQPIQSVAKAQKKGEFAAALCVGNFLGETRDAPADAAPLPVYVVTGEDAIDADLASRLAAKNVRWLGRSGCEEVAGLRITEFLASENPILIRGLEFAEMLSSLISLDFFAIMPCKL